VLKIDEELKTNDLMWNETMNLILRVPELEVWKYINVCRVLTEGRNRLLILKEKNAG
jgi:hypothetical protein